MLDYNNIPVYGGIHALSKYVIAQDDDNLMKVYDQVLSLWFGQC